MTSDSQVGGRHAGTSSILGVPISSTITGDAKLVSFVNPYSIMVLSRRVDLCSGPGLVILSDGILIPILAKIFYGVRLHRFSFDFTSLARPVLERAQLNRDKVAVVGGAVGVAEAAGNIFEKMYPGIRLVLSRHGFFESEQDMLELALEIERLGVNVVLLGMGAGRQEEMLRALIISDYKGYAYTCGGFLDQTVSGDGDYYPRWIDACHLRAVYRFVREPRRLWRRYFLSYPVFFVAFLREWVARKGGAR